MAFSFGSSQPAAASTAPLFGSSTASTTAPAFGAPASGGLFGSTAPSTTATTGGLFGATGGLGGTSATAPAPLFGAAAPATNTALSSSTTGAAAPAGGLFGSAAPSTTAATGSLFGGLGGASTAAPTSAPLFGTPAAGTAAAPATNTALSSSTTGAAAPAAGSLFGSATGSLFGAPAAAAPTGLGGTTTAAQPAPAATAPLFGAPAAGTSLFPSTTSAAAPAAGSLFGAPATSTATGTTLGGGGLFGTPKPTGPIGLGGSTTTNTTGTLNIGGTTALGAAATEKENIREGEVPQPIMELWKQTQIKIKENKDKADEFQKASNDGVKVIKHRLREVDHLISEGISAAAARDAVTATLSAKVTRDCRLGKEAQAVQEYINSRSSHNVAQQHAIEHIIHLIREYDVQVMQYQEMIEHMTIKIRDILQGHSQLTTAELKEYLGRFDVIFSSVANKLFEANAKVEDLRLKLNSDDQERIKDSRPVQQSWAQLKGPPAFPSQAVLTQIGAMLKPTGSAPAATTGTGIFGASTSTGTSLFGSSAAASKPLFGSNTATTGGGLFSSLPTSTTNPAPTGTSLFNSLATSTPTKPAFGSTVSANSSAGLLFGAKK